ncbi:uncharacterized protein LOC120659001 [Panicum virgatum]|uniref:uncharacterized protein LOC120659001 n=1 Tax=Panicum virgatum TaxID=38727 RepID=UPI0019D5CAF6|nr:uncharacterized protein LOC120659001 [Panicum virgatum]
MADDNLTTAAIFQWVSSSRARLLIDDDDDTTVVGHMIHEEEARRREGGRRGSVPGHIVIDREHGSGHARIMADYFVENPVYTDAQFRRRYRMRRVRQQWSTGAAFQVWYSRAD